MKPFSNNAKRLIYFSTYLFAAIMSTFCWLGYTYLHPLGAFANEVGLILSFNHVSYASPIVIIQSIGYFLYFSTLNLTAGSENSISFMPYVFLMVILVFTSCTIIEYFRQLLFKFISTRKVSIKIREKYYNSLSKIFITD